MDMDQVSEYIRASKDVLNILKTLGSLLPKGPQSDEAEQRLEQAEKALRASEAQLAKSLGYKLCQCTFPPQIMLSKGHHDVHNVELFVCPECTKQHPSEHEIRQYDEVKTENERLDRGYERGFCSTAHRYTGSSPRVCPRLPPGNARPGG